MKQLRLVALVLAVSAWGAASASACDTPKSASAASAGSKGCCASGTTATAASASGHACSPEMAAHCAKGAKMTMAGGSCQMHGASMASASHCEMHGLANHTDCAVCVDEAGCENEVHAMGARSQVVPLKNGAMLVFTAEAPKDVRALRAAVARHNDRVVTVLSGGDSGLCSDCKRLRGAMASGKLVREVVNVEHGCQVIITSSDRAIVQQIHEMTGAQLAARVKI